MSIKPTRRQWLKFSAASAAALALTSFEFAPVSLAQNGSRTLIKLSSNENPYGFSPKARQALLEAVDQGNRYANPETVARLEQEIAAREGLKLENVVLGTGSGEVLCMTGIAYGWPGGEIVSPDPTFAMLARYAANFNARVVDVPLNSKMEHDLEAMARQISPKTSLVYVCNPNNPTATVTPGAALKQFCQEAARRATVFVDEAYLEYTEEFPRNSMVGLVRGGENVIIARTFSKIYGMAGLRLGYGLARADLAQRLKKFRMTWFNNLTVQAALASLQDAEFVPLHRRRNREVREMFCRELDQMNISYAESHANFVWVKAGESNRDLPQKLAAHNIQIGARNPLVEFEGFRVTIGTADEMQALVRALREIRKN